MEGKTVFITGAQRLWVESERLIRPRTERLTRPAAHDRSLLDCAVMSAKEVDDYLRGIEEPGRSALERLRTTILEIVPDAEQVISYGLPAFRVRGATVAGFAAFKNHLSYVPFSGSVLGQLGDELKDYKMTKSSLHFDAQHPLPKALVKKLIATRLAEADRRSR
jgi:uncharacterized protein YdhG (YjbR/CyaY superfamily)